MPDDLKLGTGSVSPDISAATRAALDRLDVKLDAFSAELVAKLDALINACRSALSHKFGEPTLGQIGDEIASLRHDLDQARVKLMLLETPVAGFSLVVERG